MGDIVVDHFVYGVDDLEAASERYVQLIKRTDPNSQVNEINKPSYGGKHRGRYVVSLHLKVLFVL